MLPPLFPTTFDPRIWPHIEINSPPSIGPATAPGATPRLPSIAPQPPPGIDIRSSAATTQNPNLQPAAQQAMRNARLQPLPVGLPYAQANGGKLQDPWSVPIARQAPGVPPTLSVRPVAASNFILANAGDDAMRLQRQRPPLQDQETQRRNQATRPSIAGRPPVLRPKAQGFSQLIEAYRRRLSEVEGRQSITDQSLPHLPLNENVVPSYASADGGPSVIASFDYARSLAKTAYQAYGSNTEGNKSTRPSISDAYPEPLIPGAQYAQVVGQRNDAVLNNPRIDRTTERLLSILAETVQSLGSGAGPIFGIQAHFEFANRVKELNIPGIREEGVEQSFSLGEAARYGLAGSVRTDVVLRDRFGIPIAVYDLKTGNAKLSPSRVREIRDAVGVPNIPVIELRYRSESSLLR
jgi:hypothetical protein